MALGRSLFAFAALAVFAAGVRGVETRQTDPCAAIAPKLPYVAPAEALACMRSFSFNQTLRQNILANANGVLNFFTFEPYYLNSPPPFQESTINIRAELLRMSLQHYATDYDFSVDLYNTTGLLNDGHTRWFPSCYLAWQNLLPAPIVSLSKGGEESIYIVPDLVELVNLVGAGYTAYLASLGFDWQRLAGAKVLEINGQSAYDYVDYIAKVVSSNFLDHGVRVNSVYSSYRIVGSAWSQRFGYLAGPSLPTLNGLTFKVILVNATTPETIFVPYVAVFGGADFTDKASYWDGNCALKEFTNGEDLLGSGTDPARRTRKQPVGNIVDPTQVKSVILPPQYEPTQPPLTSGSEMIFYQLPAPNNDTGVVMIGSFYPDDFYAFQSTALEGVQTLKNAGVTKLIVDVHNNGGGYVCLGSFFYTLLAGTKSGYAGFESTMRWTPLADKEVDRIIEQDIEFLFYTPDNYAFLNDTLQPNDYDYMEPATTYIINGQVDKNSKRFHDTCQQYAYDPDLVLPEDPPFPLGKVVVVGNGNCASTCALFTTLLTEKYNIREYVFGVKPGASVEHGWQSSPGLARPRHGVQDNEAARRPSVSTDLLIDGDFRINWRTAWSWRNLTNPIAYQSERATRVPYTPDTYNAPQNLWTQVATTIL
ncbi:hypothetical protein BKA62DRAFT_772734 [Auriculariales sp. MPI-PUGE-AT-0066]|nr:hypothetical protein BKA62DRAFT_772734 [Auriculariales sp. MPI-PUGE-AT-0066]